jgi:hypothetical protein
MLQYVQSQGLDFFHMNHNARSPLHKAAVQGNETMCRWLLTPISLGGGGLGLAHMLPEQQGDTPMSLAAAAGCYSLRTFLAAAHDTLLRAAAGGGGADATDTIPSTTIPSTTIPSTTITTMPSTSTNAAASCTNITTTTTTTNAATTVNIVNTPPPTHTSTTHTSTTHTTTRGYS